jgi:hypothetical protein
VQTEHSPFTNHPLYDEMTTKPSLVVKLFSVLDEQFCVAVIVPLEFSNSQKQAQTKNRYFYKVLCTMKRVLSCCLTRLIC